MLKYIHGFNISLDQRNLFEYYFGCFCTIDSCRMLYKKRSSVRRLAASGVNGDFLNVA